MTHAKNLNGRGNAFVLQPWPSSLDGSDVQLVLQQVEANWKQWQVKANWKQRVSCMIRPWRSSLDGSDDQLLLQQVEADQKLLGIMHNQARAQQLHEAL
eukprot:1161711-Pelagomonas_calceolata.AAC.7